MRDLRQQISVILSAGPAKGPAWNPRMSLLQLPVLFRRSLKLRHLDRTLSEQSESKGQWRDPRIVFRSPTLRQATRLLQTLAVCCVMVLMLGASDPSHRFNKLGHEMICTCSCGQILLECNHVGCPVSGPMIGELQAQMSTGGTDTSILNWFAAKYGATVLAAPIRGGFDNVAWIAPIVVFFLATIGTAVVIRIWKLRSSPVQPLTATGAGNPEADALRARIRRETEY